MESNILPYNRPTNSENTLKTKVIISKIFLKENYFYFNERIPSHKITDIILRGLLKYIYILNYHEIFSVKDSYINLKINISVNN